MSLNVKKGIDLGTILKFKQIFYDSGQDDPPNSPADFYF